MRKRSPETQLRHAKREIRHDLKNTACQSDPFDWGDRRTMPNAHHWITSHWFTLNDGDVVDVEYILHETIVPKLSEDPDK